MSVHMLSILFPGENHSIAITADGQAWTWGSSSHGQLGHGSKVRTRKQGDSVLKVVN
jgi:alpha-tubulin suppressor-like RCC1 family protein